MKLKKISSKHISAKKSLLKKSSSSKKMTKAKKISKIVKTKSDPSKLKAKDEASTKVYS